MHEINLKQKRLTLQFEKKKMPIFQYLQTKK